MNETRWYGYVIIYMYDWKPAIFFLIIHRSSAALYYQQETRLSSPRLYERDFIIIIKQLL